MSPAPLAADLQPDRQLKILARAFEALLLTTQRLTQKEHLLHQRLEYAHDEVNSSSFSSTTHFIPHVSSDERT
jgi:hypothetical protein